jgi:hypothetical protein
LGFVCICLVVEKYGALSYYLESDIKRHLTNATNQQAELHDHEDVQDKNTMHMMLLLGLVHYFKGCGEGGKIRLEQM